MVSSNLALLFFSLSGASDQKGEGRTGRFWKKVVLGGEEGKGNELIPIVTWLSSHTFKSRILAVIIAVVLMDDFVNELEFSDVVFRTAKMFGAISRRVDGNRRRRSGG